MAVKMSQARPVVIRAARFSFQVRPVPLRVCAQFGELPVFFFENKTPYVLGVDFLIDDLVSEEASGRPVRVLSVPADGCSINLRVNTAKSGHHEYHVKMVDISQRLHADFEASGGSAPDIEIVP